MLHHMPFYAVFKTFEGLVTYRVGRATHAKPARLPSRPGGFHPEPRTDPDLNLSIHPVCATVRGLPLFR